MSLTQALNVARSGLTVTALQTDLVSRNIANSTTEGFARKSADLVTSKYGSVSASSVDRSVSTMLQRLDRENESKLTRQSTISDGLRAFTDFLGQPSDEVSPAAKIAGLHDAVVTLAGMPSEEAAQIQVVTVAKQVAENLNDLSANLTDIRQEVERNIRYDVVAVNEALQSVASYNQKILQAETGSAVQAEYMDHMDRLLDEVSGYMDIQTVNTEDGTINLYTGGGTELVVGTRTKAVTYDAVAGTLAAGGIEITPGGPARGISQGSLSGLFDLKLNRLPEIGAQLDALAGSLVSSMEAANPFGTTGTGLFTDAGAVFDPAAIDGLAGRIRVNAEADNTVGGDPALLQSGGIATTPAGDSSFIDGMLTAFTQPVTVGTAGLGAGLTLIDFAPTMVTYQQSARAGAEADTLATQTAGETISASRENYEGVSIDDEMQKLLVIEQSYAANARVMTSVNEMLDTLMRAFG
ncbi:flagellar hook-associated protein FlgK [Psychromarinibacter halotolerans]|uniref:Flagellar hook-associated protein 1 n=1 Tax=Psychromarinibacter halotolerans TaxID=1775175 RepID=A0ABV7GPQ4_9RHOB|nr:flagellar hook-associated protein FlgK [Psychromarinibacter halotolerans]MDF0595816.1 flagellar hook-associated protein FlgK [Psychromarinibacter halotolerans]